MNAFAAINIACNERGLDEDTRRDLYERLTGKRSLRAMTPAELDKVTAELKRPSGFTGASKPARKPLEGRFAKTLVALWLDGFNLGIIRNPEDSALLAFVKAQTGIDHVRFLHHAADAKKAIEALKAWLAREGGVIWPSRSDARGRQLAVIAAQYRRLDVEPEDILEADPISVMQQLGKRIRARGRRA